jgi:hypothetical protein
MIDTETKILFVIFIILYFFSSYKYTIIYVLFWLFIYLFGFFLTSIGLDIENVKLENSEIFYLEHTGDYSSIFGKLKEYNNIKRQFKFSSESFSPFGIFYDDPEKNEPSQCRAVYGFIKHDPKEFKEIKEFLKNHNYKSRKIPESDTIMGTYSSLFHIQNSFIFIAKLIIQMTNLKFFRRLHHPKWKESKIKTARNNYKKHLGVMYIIRPSKVDIYIPIENTKDFFLHSSSTAPSKINNKKAN